MRRGGGGAAVLLVVAGALLVFALVMSFVGGTSVGTNPGKSPGSTENRGRDGAYAWAETLRRLGYGVVARQRALDDGELPASGTIVLVDPEEVTVQEVDALADWLRTPGRKVVVVGDTDPKVMRRLVPGLDTAPGSQLAPSAEMVAVGDAPESAGADELIVDDAGGHLLSPGDGTALYAPASGGDAAYVVRYQDSGGGVVVTVADDATVTNDAIADGSNAGFATAVVGPPPGPVTFDQFRHQPTQIPGTFGYLPRSVQYLLIQLVVVGVVAALAAGIRRGPPLPEPEVPPRRRIEYVQALARSYHDAGGYWQATERMKADLRDRLRKALKLGGDAGDAELVAAAPQAGLDPEAVAAILYGAPTDALGFRTIAAGATALRRQLTG